MGERVDLHGLLLGTPLDSLVEAVIRRGETTDPAVIMSLTELIGAYDGFESKGPLRFQQRWRDPLCEVLARWADILMASPDRTRQRFAELARAIGRLADPRLLPVLQRLLEEDLVRWRRAREERARNGGALQHPEAYMSWTNWYGRAFATFDGEEVTERMNAWLTNVHFGTEAATVLVQHWERHNGGPISKAYSIEPSFAKARQQRLEQDETKYYPVSSQTADVILAVAESASRPEAGPEQHALAMRLTAVAMQLPHGDRSSLINHLLSLTQPRREKQKLLRALAEGGQVIPAVKVMEGFTSLLEEAKTKTWLLDPHQNQRWELDAWLELLPFSDDPMSVMTALGMLKPELRQPWNLRGVLSALGRAPTSAIEPVLVALAETDPRFVQEHHWIAALEQGGTEAAARLMLDLVIRHRHSSDAFRSGRLFAVAVRISPAFREEVYARYEQGPAAVSQLLEPVIAEAADEAAIRLLISHIAAQGRSFAQSYLHRALEQVALGRQPAAANADVQAEADDEFPPSGTYDVFSVPVTELRKQLFAIVGANTPQSVLAADCLNAIDEIRDDYGAAESEPRHPDITAGRSWPLV